MRTYFKDPEGRDIIPPEDGDKPKKDIPGYEYVGPKKDKDGNTIHVYRKITEVTRWIDKEGNKLQNDKPGKHPDNDGVSDIPGYRLIDVRNEPNGDVTNRYVKVRTYFKDTEGRDIIPPEDGDKPKKDIPGYDYVGAKKDDDGNTIHVYKQSRNKLSDKRLPETGDPISLFGVGLASLIAGRRVRRKTK